jgi:PleD family two-component response regulator
VILAILDDLMFTSKIRSAASAANVPVTIVRSSAAALEQMRTTAPSLVVLDLNNPRTDPLGIVRAMKSDASLAAVPTLGYVSHVDTETIEAARQAGVTDVLPRSAFSARLAEILRRA